MLDQERKTDVAQWMRRHGHLLLAVLLGMLLACQDSPPEVPSSHARPNILFLLIDALRADRLGCYGNPRATSPVLDAYSPRGVRFATVISQSSHTKLSVASIFTGLIPPSHGVRNAGTLKEAADKDAEVKSDVLSEGLTTVAELLQGRGYRTLAVVTNPHLLGKMGFAQGFESYVYKRHSTPARKINQEALRLLSEGGEGPFFLYTHYMDVHAPYDPPPEYAERFTRGLVKTDVVYVNGRYRHKLSADELAYSQAMYEAQIRYWDDEFGSFMRELGDRGYLDNTLVIIASDHGDEFYEHRGFGHGYTCYEEVLRVPLIMVWPGVLPEETLRDDTACLIDLLPTIAHVAGADTDGILLQGQNLYRHGWKSRSPGPASADGEDPPAIYAETYRGSAPHCLRTEHLKVIYNETRRTYESYDLEHDPYEQNSLETLKLAEGERLVDRLKIHMNLTPAVELSPEQTLDEDLVNRLKSLGYLND